MLYLTTHSTHFIYGYMASDNFRTLTKKSLFLQTNSIIAPKTTSCTSIKIGLVRDSNPGPLAPKARIIPLDQRADIDMFVRKPYESKYYYLSLVLPPVKMRVRVT